MNPFKVNRSNAASISDSTFLNNNELIKDNYNNKVIPNKLSSKVNIATNESSTKSLLSQQSSSQQSLNHIVNLNPNPLLSVSNYLKPVFVTYPNIVHLNTDNYYNGQKVDAHGSAMERRKTNEELEIDENYYEKVIDEEIYQSPGSAEMTIKSNGDLFTSYSLSNNPPNLTATLHPKASTNVPSLSISAEEDDLNNDDHLVTVQHVNQSLLSEDSKSILGGNDEEKGTLLLDSNAASLEELSVKKLSELDNLLFPRQDLNKKNRSASVATNHDKTPEVINMERMKNKSTLLSHYFEDGKRRVDYVIVFNKSSNTNLKSEEMVQIKQRMIFENNLREEGLHLEYMDNISGSNHVFVKIYAPWAVLTHYAEIMKLKMPMKTMQTTWKMLFDEDEDHSMRFTAPYSKDKEYLFDIPPQKELFFSTAQRAQVIEFILKRKSFSKNKNNVTEFGINKLLSDKVYVAAYPIHEGKLKSDYRSPRMQLIETWASLKCSFKNQPLDEIRRYFGTKIALYFAWLGFYTSMLIPASAVGLLCFIFGSATLDKDIPSKEMCNGTYDSMMMCPQCAHDCNFTRISEMCIYAKTTYLFDNPATVFFAVFMSLWATVYLEMWKRYSARITYRWDLSNFDAVEEYPRPEYLARLSNSADRRFNVITRMYEPYIPFWRRQLPYTIISVSVVLFLILIALGSVVSVIVYRGTIRSAIRFKRYDTTAGKLSLGFFQKYSSIIVSSSAAALNLIFILILNNIYSRIANYLTELEMPRTQSEFDNSLTLKMFLLQFVNYYSSIFYIAFFKGRFIGNPGEFKDESLTQEECAAGGCLLELAIQLAIIMIGRQLFSAALELCMPFAKTLYSRWWYRKENSVTWMMIPQWEDDFLLTDWSPTSLFYEYLEMVIQFGFVTIFVCAFPLAPLFALINNIFEIRLDARKMITQYKRPVAQRVKNIGIWYRILDTICKLSVITNAMIIAFTTEFVPRLLYYFEQGSLSRYFNTTLSYFDAKYLNQHLKLDYNNNTLFDYCVYPDYREPPWANEKVPYQFTSYYWRLLAVRLFFVVIFENVIVSVTSLMRWVIPDIPRQLRQQMRQHAYLTNELILQQEYNRAKEMSNENKYFMMNEDGGGGGGVGGFGSSRSAKSNHKKNTYEHARLAMHMSSETISNRPKSLFPTSTSDHNWGEGVENSFHNPQKATLNKSLLTKAASSLVLLDDYELMQNSDSNSLNESSNFYASQYLIESTSRDQLIETLKH